METPKPPKMPFPQKKPIQGISPPLPPGVRTTPVPPQPGQVLPNEHQGTAPGEVVRRLDRIEERSQDMAGSRKHLEDQLRELEQRLHEEREKALLENLRSKEEAALSSKVEISLKDMQERMAQEQRTQELQATNQRAREQIQEMEEKLRAERETWIKTLQDQMSGRDHQDQELEVFFSRKLENLERTWNSEKEELESRIRQTEEHLEHEKMRSSAGAEKREIEFERRQHERTRELEGRIREEKEHALQFRRERDLNIEKIDDREKEYMTIKAQIALMHSQVKLEKERLNQTWVESLRQKEEEAESMKQSLIHAESAYRERLKTETESLKHQHREAMKHMQDEREQESAQHAAAVSDLNISVSESRVKLANAEERLKLLEKGKNTVDGGLNKEYERLAKELEKTGLMHQKERAIWKESLQEIEKRLQNQKREWQTSFDQEVKKSQGFAGSLHEKDSRMALLEKNLEDLKEKYWNERDIWSEMTASKDDQLQEMYEKVEELNGEVRAKEAQAWSEKDKQMQIRDQLNREFQQAFSRIEKENRTWADTVRHQYEEALSAKDQKIWQEKDQHIETIREKEELIGRLQKEASFSQDQIRAQMDKEFQAVLCSLEGENQKWAEKIREHYVAEATIKENALCVEIKAIKKAMDQELETLDKEREIEMKAIHQQAAEKERSAQTMVSQAEGKAFHVEQDLRHELHNKELLHQKLDKKEEEIRTAVKASDDRYGAEMHRLQNALQEKDHKVELVQERYVHLDEKLQETCAHLRDALQGKEKAQERKSEEKDTAIEQLKQQYAGKMAAIEKEINELQKPRTLFGKIWAYLNRPVICISFRKLF